MTNQNVVGRISALLLAVALVQARGATYYVSTSGNDGNPGTSSAPCRTITYAYSRVGAGDTIIVMSGIYTDYTSGWGLHLGSSGTASSPITLKSQVRGGAIIDGQNASDRNVAIYIDGNYNIVDGFEIRNGPNGGITIWSNGNQIRNNEIHNNGNPASTSTNGRDGVYSNEGTSGNSYTGNYIHDNGRTGSNLDHGLYLCGANENVFNNISIRNAATGLQVAGYTTVSNMRVYNNVIAYNGTSGIILWQALNGVDIKNNIVCFNGTWGINSYAATGGGVVVDQDVIYGNGSGSYNFSNGGSTYSYSLGTVSLSDPVLVNESSSGFDAHLASGSPAIGAGLNLYAYLTTDLAGALRPSSGAWDLGAYVYGSGSTADTTPPTVSITAPANGATVSGTAVMVSANASDNVGVASVQFQLDGANYGAAVTVAPYSVAWNTTTAANGTHTLSATAKDAAGNQATASSVSVVVSNASPSPLGNGVVWVEDALPAGAVGSADGGDSWNWISSNPAPSSGLLAHQSNLASGLHEHWFNWATATLSVGAGDTLYTYVYLDPANVPSELMLSWNDGSSWEHRAYWGANDITYGSSGTASRTYMGPLPPAGQWVQLTVPAATVGLAGVTVYGMGFSLYNGRATWDAAGKSSGSTADTTPPTVSLTAPANGATVSGSAVTVSANASDNVGVASVQFTCDGANLGAAVTVAPYTVVWNTATAANGTHTLSAIAKDAAGNAASAPSISVVVSNSTPSPATNIVAWVDDALPSGAVGGADGGDGWNWISSNPTPYSGRLAQQSNLASGLHEHWFNWAYATLSVNTGDTLVAYVYLDPANVPSELMLSWNDGAGWEHRAYWGANLIAYGVNGTVSRYYVGPLPAAGQWVQLTVPASAVGLQGATVPGMGFSLYGGRATWDSVGKISASATAALASLPRSGNGAGPTMALVGPSWQRSVPPSGLFIQGLRFGSQGATLTWASVPGTVYHVFARDNLQGAWQEVSGAIPAKAAATSWVDPATSRTGTRFYTLSVGDQQAQ